MFSEELLKRLIKMFSFSGKTVLEPFLGSGTTSLATMKLRRNSIGYEINKEFATVVREKLSHNLKNTENHIEFYNNKKSTYDYIPYHTYFTPHTK
jgi:DNA modification methylase